MIYSENFFYFQMLFFFITCVSLIFFYNSLPLKPLPKWAYEGRLVSPWCWKDLSLLPISNFLKTTLSGHFIPIPSKMSMKKWNPSLKVENFDDATKEEICLLDLPELVLELIMERLPPDGLRSMAGVCTGLRHRCTSDSLWELHMKRKWGCIIGQAALREWQSNTVSRKETDLLERSQRISLTRSLYRLWPFSLIRPRSHNYAMEMKSLLPIDSIMSRYLALESGKFWFPAQVYNRENGHVGFMLSCYDAELCYDSRTDTFQARYPPHGRRAAAVENGVIWDRLREPPIVDISPHDLHISDCLNELLPGDHIEIQWRRNKEFPYGWWYGVVGHLESCDGNDNYCRCGESNTVVLEFNQYAPGSRWRQTSVHRGVHREEGNETDGFYGGVRKLYDNDEISMWRQLWPVEILE